MNFETFYKFLKLNRCFSRETFNVILIGLAFSFIFMAFSTTQALSVSALKTAFSSTNNSTQSILIDNIGYYTLLCVYIVFTISNIIAPSVVKLFGTKLCLIISSCSYVLFVAVYIYPLVYTLYGSACLIGVGAAILWTSQGKLLLDNSNHKTVERNSGIFLSLFVFNFVPGNLFVYFYLRDSMDISVFDRFIIFPVLTLLGLIGVILFFFILPIDKNILPVERDKVRFPIRMKDYFVTFISVVKDLLLVSFRVESLLIIPLFYTSGLSINLFAGGVYVTCFGNIEAPLYTVGFAALSLLLSGIGGIIGSILFSINGTLSRRLTRKFMLLLALMVDSIALLLIYYNTPPYCNYPQPPPNAQLFNGALLHPSNLYVALVCSVFLGLADSIIKSILYSIIGIVYEKSMTAPAVSIYKFFESLALIFSFFYNPLIHLYFQILIFEIIFLTSYVLYIFVEVRVSRREMNKAETRVLPLNLFEVSNQQTEIELSL